jgi:hypothetical protein
MTTNLQFTGLIHSNQQSRITHPSVDVEYCTFSFKSTGGVMRDPFYLFDISAVTEFLRDTSKISAFEPKILPLLPFFSFFR